MHYITKALNTGLQQPHQGFRVHDHHNPTIVTALTTLVYNFPNIKDRSKTTTMTTTAV